MIQHPVKSLSETDRWRLRPHFKSLGKEDRRLRFGATLNDAALDRYVDLINFDTDTVLGIESDDAALVAAVHVAPVGEGAELGLSVLDGNRGRGMGSLLFEQAVLWARNRYLNRIFMHCLRENRAILSLARRHGMRIEFEGGDSTAVLCVPDPDLDSWVGEQATYWRAITNDAMRVEGRWFDALWAMPFKAG